MPDFTTHQCPTHSSPGTLDTFDLENFFPYQVRRYYIHVTTAVSRCYRDKYNMSRHEWRTMAVLGPVRRMTEVEIVDNSGMYKVTVSRGLTTLDKRGWLSVSANTKDGRSKLLRLSKSGLRVYDALVPKILAAEQALLSGLSEREIRQMQNLMARIREIDDRMPSSIPSGNK